MRRSPVNMRRPPSSAGLSAELHNRYRAGDISPVDITRRILDGIRELDPQINAFCLVDPEAALAQARASEARFRAGNPLSILDGIPVSIKDTIAVKGWPTRRGSLAGDPAPAPGDAIAVERLRRAGTIFVGKTTTPEFAWKGLTTSPLTGTTRNPWAPAFHAGGSSGGGAAAVAAGLGVIGLGSDAAGSVRIPAAFCGTVGYKPTFGHIPVAPVPSAFSRMAHFGPMSATVADAQAAVAIMRGAGEGDWHSHSADAKRRPQEMDHGKPLRIGAVSMSGVPVIDPTVVQAFSDACASLRVLGYSIGEAAIDFAEARRIASTLYRCGCEAAVRRIAVERRSELDGGLLEFIESVEGMSLAEYFELEAARDALAGRIMNLFETFDLLLLPTMPMPAFPADLESPPGWPKEDWMSWNPFTVPFNLSHCPVISLPWFRPGQGLPVGIQLAAAPHNDRLMLGVASQLEQEVRFAHPPLWIDLLAG